MAGTAGIQNPLYVYFTQTVAGAANNDYTLTRAGTIVDAWIYGRATQAGGTAAVTRVRAATPAAITDLMNAAVDQAVIHAGIINDANNAVIVGDALRFSTTGAATLVDAVAMLVPAVADSTAL